MSLGFLTESALIPKKSKAINVDPSSVRRGNGGLIDRLLG